MGDLRAQTQERTCSSTFDVRERSASATNLQHLSAHCGIDHCGTACKTESGSVRARELGSLCMSLTSTLSVNFRVGNVCAQALHAVGRQTLPLRCVILGWTVS